MRRKSYSKYQERCHGRECRAVALSRCRSGQHMALREVFARTLLEMVVVKKWNSKAIKINCHQLQQPVSTQRSGRRQRWVYSRMFCSCNIDRIEIGLEVCVAWIYDLIISAKAQESRYVSRRRQVAVLNWFSTRTTSNDVPLPRSQRQRQFKSWSSFAAGHALHGPDSGTSVQHRMTPPSSAPH